jgi:serine/threonine protein phosphatase PrpC
MARQHGGCSCSPLGCSKRRGRRLFCSIRWSWYVPHNFTLYRFIFKVELVLRSLQACTSTKESLETSITVNTIKSIGLHFPHLENKDFHQAIQSGFLNLDEELKQDEETKEQMSGTTAVTVLVKGNKLYCGNAGDSRAVISQRGKAVPLSVDHKPNDPEEMKRIIAAGGWVDACRVNGNLALSRALGDFIFKNNDSLKAEEQIVTGMQ